MRAGKNIKQKIQQTLHLLPALRLVWQSSPGWTIARIVLLVIQGILPVISIYLTKLIIDAVVANLNVADKTVAFRNVILWVILAGVVTLVSSICSSLTEL